jgi:quinolinate synthase
VTINKGECYVIESLKTDATPRVKVANNPNSLAVHTETPGQIVMVGADSGSWNFDVTLASGEKVTYAVTIKALAPPQGSLVPVSAPTAIP